MGKNQYARERKSVAAGDMPAVCAEVALLWDAPVSFLRAFHFCFVSDCSLHTDGSFSKHLVCLCSTFRKTEFIILTECMSYCSVIL